MRDSPSTPPNGGHSEALLAELYVRLRGMATRQMMKESQPQTLQATALVHEAWLQLTASDHAWHDQAYFCAAAAQTMRRILIQNARRKSRIRHGGGLERIEISEKIAEQMPEECVILIDEGLSELEKTNPERAQIVALKFFGGFTNEEVARTLKTSTRSVEREWACAKAWLYHWMSKER